MLLHQCAHTCVNSCRWVEIYAPFSGLERAMCVLYGIWRGGAFSRDIHKRTHICIYVGLARIVYIRRIFDEIPAKNTVYTLYVYGYMVLANPTYKCLHMEYCMHTVLAILMHRSCISESSPVLSARARERRQARVAGPSHIDASRLLYIIPMDSSVQLFGSKTRLQLFAREP